MWHMHKQRVYILFLQETNFKGPHSQIPIRYFKTWYTCNNPDHKAKGEANGFNSTIPVAVKGTVMDAMGR